MYSFRKLDATVQADNSVRTINTNGLHRTASELQRRSTLGCHTTAAHVAWDTPSLRLGATGMYQRYDHQFRQGAALYRQIYPEGYQFGAVGMNYNLRLGHFMASGEGARSFATRAERKVDPSLTPGQGWATIHKMAWRFNPNTTVAAIGRYYSRCYYSTLASAYGENSRVQNESGMALLVDADKVGPLELHALADLFYSPWPRYTMTRASRGFELVAQATCHISRNTLADVRYSIKSKERTDRRYRTNRLRVTLQQRAGTAVTVQLMALASMVALPAQDMRAEGLALMPRINYAPERTRLSASLALSVFATGLGAPADYVSAAYDSRLFAYEPSLYQSFGIAQMTGRGEHLASTLKWQPAARWQLQAKCGVTHYRDRDAISSGFLLIDSRWKSEITFLVRWMLR